MLQGALQSRVDCLSASIYLITSQYGYGCATGWDAVTGLGTPNFTAILQYVQTLP
jgi:hypothetical protein